MDYRESSIPSGSYEWLTVPPDCKTLIGDVSQIGRGLELSPEDQLHLIEAARNNQPVEGLTHNHYRYPARFSPILIKRIIETFSAPGELVFDPYVGGGTTMVEALALGRRGLGTDISSLATFVTRAKTLLVDEACVEALKRWAVETAARISMHSEEPAFPR